MTYTIYALADPRIDDRVKRLRYVGMSCGSAEGRRKTHIYEAKTLKSNLHKAHWIRQLLAEHLEPSLVILHRGIDDEDGPSKEALFHKTLKAIGAPLCNLRIGDQVLLKHSEETKAKLRARVYAPETRARMSASAKLRPARAVAPETGRRISAAKMGKPRRGSPISAQTREKIRIANTGKRHAPETIAKLRGNKNCLGRAVSVAHRAKSSQNNARKINLAIADDIRATASEYGLTQRQLAMVFGVSQPIIGKVLRNEMWKHWELVG